MFSTKLMTNTILLKSIAFKNKIFKTQSIRPHTNIKIFMKKKKIYEVRREANGLSFENKSHLSQSICKYQNSKWSM